VAKDYGVQGALVFTIVLVAGSTILDLVMGMLAALLLNISFRGHVLHEPSTLFHGPFQPL